MRKSFIIGGGIALLLILSFGIYFFASGKDLEGKKDKLQKNIIVTENKLSKEKRTLDAMLNELNNSFPLGASIQNQMKKASDTVRQTDFMFINPEGSNPEFIIKNFPSALLIGNERKNINLLISLWQKETDILSIGEIDIYESEKIQKDTETIKMFLENLAEIMESLTPENSGLSQFQIDTYLAQLPSVETINEILVSMGTAIENANNDSSQTNNDSSENISFTTPEEIIIQQTVVSETQTQVTALQEQLAQVEQQIAEQSPPAPVEIENTANPEPIDLENQDTENEDIMNNSVVPYNANLNPKIIIQPGEPRLIEGSNQY